MSKINYIRSGEYTVAVVDFDPYSLSRFGARLNVNKIDHEFGYNPKLSVKIKKCSEDVDDQDLANEIVKCKLINKRNKIYKRLIESCCKEFDDTINKINSIEFKKNLKRIFLKGASEVKFIDHNPIIKYEYFVTGLIWDIFESTWKSCYPRSFCLASGDLIDIQGVNEMVTNDGLSFDGVVRCNPDDTFDSEIGHKICTLRLNARIEKRLDGFIRQWSRNLIKAKDNMIYNYNGWCYRNNYKEYMISDA